MKAILIAAMTKSRLIGKESKVPWHQPEDLRFFKETTTSHAVIMGRKTFDSVGKPLPARRNIVITRNKGWKSAAAAPPGTTLDIVHSLDAALDLCRDRGEKKVFIVGGAEIYALALPIADEMLITFVDWDDVTGDTYFPEWNPVDWKEEESKASGRLRFVRYRRIR